MASANLSKTPGSAGNRKKFNFSFWIKGNDFVSDYIFFSASGSTESAIIFDSSSRLEFYEYNGSSKTTKITTKRVFKDPSAWYHIVVSIDTTQSTSTNRVKLYVNGSQETDLENTTYGAQDFDSLFNNTTTQYIGSTASGGNFDGSMTHIHFNDGYTYDASTFGETDSTSGIWKPKTAPSVTYGTNGFFLKFENSGAMGTDSSGNSNTYAVSGTLTQNVDSPTNNFATLNPLFYTTTSGTLDFGNRNFTKSSSVNRSCFSTLAPSAGKWYCEVKVANDTDCKLGIADISADYNFNGQTLDFSDSTYGYSYNEAGTKSVAGNSSSYGTGYNAADIIGIAMDLDNSKLYFSLNGTFQDSGVPTSGSTGTGAISINAGGTYAFAGKVNGGTDLGFNFGSGDYSTSSTVASGNADDNGIGSFEYDVPAGYYALCTKNIKEFG